MSHMKGVESFNQQIAYHIAGVSNMVETGLKQGKKEFSQQVAYRFAGVNKTIESGAVSSTRDNLSRVQFALRNYNRGTTCPPLQLLLLKSDLDTSEVNEQASQVMTLTSQVTIRASQVTGLTSQVTAKTFEPLRPIFAWTQDDNSPKMKALYNSSGLREV